MTGVAEIFCQENTTFGTQFCDLICKESRTSRGVYYLWFANTINIQQHLFQNSQISQSYKFCMLVETVPRRALILDSFGDSATSRITTTNWYF